ARQCPAPVRNARGESKLAALAIRTDRRAARMQCARRAAPRADAHPATETFMSQRVLITAGAGGMGLAIAKAFVAEGARVHIADINPDAVAQATGATPGISGSVGDVGKAADLDVLFDDVRSKLGGLDVLVNNAGIAGATAPVEEYPSDTWSAVLAVNL